jgi:hypothetical protein
MPRRARDEARGASMIALTDLLRRVLSTSDFQRVQDLLRDVDPASDELDPDDFNPMTGTRIRGEEPGANDQRLYAMDSAMPGRVVADRECAIAECEPIVGRAALIACDSAASVFRTALTRLGVDHRDLPNSGLPPVFRMAKRVQSGVARPALSGRAYADFERNWPNAARIRVM